MQVALIVTDAGNKVVRRIDPTEREGYSYWFDFDGQVGPDERCYLAHVINDGGAAVYIGFDPPIVTDETGTILGYGQRA